MSRIYFQSEGTAARRRFPVYLVDATDGLTAETGEAAGQPQISKVGGTWNNTAATLTAVGNGHYYVELSATELDTLGYFAVRYKSANTAEFNMDGMVVAINIHDTVRAGLTALPNAVAEAAGGLYTRGTGAGQINQPSNGVVDVALANVAHGGAAAALTLGGGATISSASGSALTLSSSGGNGSGLEISGNGSGDGIRATGGATGHGVSGVGGATSGVGLRGVGSAGNSQGILGVGQGSAAGIRGTGGASGAGISAVGGATSGPGINAAASAGNNAGITASGFGSFAGIRAVGGATGAGINAVGGGTSGVGIQASGTAGNSAGVQFSGQGSAAGLRAVGGATGAGLLAVGGGTSGHGIDATVTSGTEIDANITGNITGNLSGAVTGAVGSVTGNVGGNVTGSVGSVVGHTAQTGDSFARLGAPAGASISADLATVDSNVDAIKAKTDNYPPGIKKNTALANFEFYMADSADHVTAKTGLSVTAQRSIDGAAFAACANAVSEVSNGVYKISLANTDLNGDTITLLFTATGADATVIHLVTEP